MPHSRAGRAVVVQMPASNSVVSSWELVYQGMHVTLTILRPLQANEQPLTCMECGMHAWNVECLIVPLVLITTDWKMAGDRLRAHWLVCEVASIA